MKRYFSCIENVKLSSAAIFFSATRMRSLQILFLFFFFLICWKFWFVNQNKFANFHTCVWKGVLIHELFVLMTGDDCFHSAHSCPCSARAHCTPVSPPGGGWVTSLSRSNCFCKTLKDLCWRNMSVSSQPVLALAAVYCNSMELFVKGNSFVIGKLCRCTSVRNKDMQWVNKHIKVNPNKQKWKSLAA